VNHDFRRFLGGDVHDGLTKASKFGRGRKSSFQYLGLNSKDHNCGPGFVIRGYIIVEGIRTGSWMENLKLTLIRIERSPFRNPGPDQPKVWTTVHFETTEDPERLATALSEALDDNPSRWYTDFATDREKFVIFPKRIFRYRIGDKNRRAEAQEYARSIGIPQWQVDWEA
jgi:hypothetical protein